MYKPALCKTDGDSQKDVFGSWFEQSHKSTFSGEALLHGNFCILEGFQKISQLLDNSRLLARRSCYVDIKKNHEIVK